MTSQIAARQRVLARAAFMCGRIGRRWGRPVDWLVGPEEIAGMVVHIGRAQPRSLTLVRTRHQFYVDPFDIVVHDESSRFGKLRRQYGAAIAFGWYAARAQGVVYVGPHGFLDGEDDREWEFTWLRARRRAIVCVFTGNDIRSPQRMAEWSEATGAVSLGPVLLEMGAPFDAPEYELTRQRRSMLAERFANAIITATHDQTSYLQRPTHPFLYFYPDSRFLDRREKFEVLDPIVVVHAPSNPVIKGTADVRAAMRSIVERYPHVEYRELSGVSNREVLAALDGAHIVINQLNAQMPGLFGIEAMARTCVMVCSADPLLETDLAGAEDAWVVADASTLEDRLSELLDAPSCLEEQALRGFHWARSHASQSASAATLQAVLSRAAVEARESDSR